MWNLVILMLDMNLCINVTFAGLYGIYEWGDVVQMASMSG